MNNEIFNVAKTICNAIYSDGFDTLNKPTHCEMIFVPLNEAQSKENFQITESFETLALGLSPKASWWNNIPEKNDILHKKIQNITNTKFYQEFSLLEKSLTFSSMASKTYIKYLLLYRIGAAVTELYKAGNCGELVSVVTMKLLEKKYRKKLDFSIVIVQIKSKSHNKEHILCVINNGTGEEIICDPWNKGACFYLRDKDERDYYKYGNWNMNNATLRADFTIPSNLNHQEKYLESYILSKYFILNISDTEYIHSAIKEFKGNMSVA